MKRFFALFIVSSLLLPTILPARDFLGLGPRAGFYKVKDAEEGEWLIGAGLRMKLGMIGFEGSIDYRAERYWNGNLVVRSWPVMASLLLYPIPIAYGIAGAGWYNTTLDYNQNILAYALLKDETTQEVGWHFGGGLELPLGRRAVLAVDIRYVFLNYDFAEVPGSEQLESDFYAVTISIFRKL